MIKLPAILLITIAVLHGNPATSDEQKYSIFNVDNGKSSSGENDSKKQSEMHYFIEMWKEFSKKSPPLRPCPEGNGFGPIKKHKIFVVWTPTDISKSDSSTFTSVTFTQLQNPNRSEFTNLTSAVLSLSLKSMKMAGNFQKGFWIRTGFRWINTTLKDPMEIEYFETRKMTPFSTHLSLDVSEMIRENIKEAITEASHITVTFQVYQISEGERRFLDFHAIFENPTIIVFLCDFSLDMDSQSLNFLSDSKRRRRNPNSKMCQRRDFFVKPAEHLHLYNIIFPEELDVGMCSGQCPFPIGDEFYNFSQYTFIQDLYRHLNPHNLPDGFEFTSCKAASYKPLLIWERNGSDISMVRVEDASVEYCQCTS